MGAYDKTKNLRKGGHWSQEEQEDHINVLELRAIFLGLKALCGSESNTHIQLYCDNTSSCANLRNFGGKKRYLNVLAIDIWNWCISRSIHLSISHVAGCLNIEAGELSKGLNLNEDLEWALYMDIFQKIVCRFGKPDIDLFASRLNHKLEKYISFRPDPNAMAADAFSISWTKQFFYIFAPFSTLSMVLRKIVEDEAEALVVAPLWTTQSWWPQLAHLIVDFFHKTSSNKQNIVLAKQPKKNSPTTETEDWGISRIREVLQGRGIQGESADLIIQAWRQSSKEQYECYLRKWLKFSGSREIDPLQPSIKLVIEILYDLYKSGVQYSGIGTARSALSGFLSLCSEGQYDTGKSVLVKKFMRGVFNKRPALPKYRTTWNPDIVLNYLSSLSSNLTLLQLSQKVCMLLILLTGQSIHLLKVEDVIFHEDSLELQFSVVLTHTRPGVHQDNIRFQSYIQNKSLCIVLLLHEYIVRTSNLRGQETQLFISTQAPF